jgi:hypothetical protein
VQNSTHAAFLNLIWPAGAPLPPLEDLEWPVFIALDVNVNPARGAKSRMGLFVFSLILIKIETLEWRALTRCSKQQAFVRLK